ncbi:MAG: archease [Thermodesulfovibrio sp.]|uniref:archease n=1 Tax=Thermodesulfovibrio sp. 1176 TaxID=3043424 RepID=UPI00248313F7|nr:archease [Thermodesulfovibrio sp. 1176]MDI1471972.1 archease [Thermodesulfovibrio sp. 1176]MDI6714996.1 archease [Thermodesulfovibrio sp.]
MSYRVIDVAGDIGLRAEGRTLQECFVNAGLGLYSLITDLNQIKQKQQIEIEIAEESIEILLVSYLNELIFQFDAYGFIGNAIDLTIERNTLKALVYGETFDPKKHERRLLIKAATYHNLIIKQENTHWIAEIIFDI